MNKKNVLLILLSCFFIFALAGCGSDGDNASDYVTLGQYKGLEVTVSPVEVTDEDMAAAVESLLKENSKKVEVTDRGIIEGDLVNIDYSGKVDGKILENGSAEGAEITVGSSGYIEGFDDGLLGAETGDTVELNLKFPDEYSLNPDVAGKDVVFTVIINSISETLIPEYTDEFVDSISEEYTTTQQYDQYLNQQLTDKKTAESKQQKISDLWDMVLENSTVNTYPDDMIEDYVKDAKVYYQEIADYYKVEMNDKFLKEYLGITEDDIYEYAYMDVGEKLVVQAIAADEQMSINDSEYQQGITDYLAQMGFDSEEAYIERYGVGFEENYGKEALNYYLLANKVRNFIEQQSIEIKA